MMTDDVAAILGDAPAVDAQALERVRRIGGSALIERMIASFLGHVPGRVDEVVHAEEAPAAMRAAHAIKSSAGNLGLARLARLAAEIEARADAGDASWATLRPALGAAFAEARAALARESGSSA